jgi:histidine triad (HIT) family protein
MPEKNIAQDQNCIFCQIIRKESPAEIEYEDADVMAFWDVRPKAPTHILIIPKKHFTSLEELQDDDLPLLSKMFSAVKKVAIKKNLTTDGYKLVINNGPGVGQIVGHLHLHLLAGKKMSEL